MSVDFTERDSTGLLGQARTNLVRASGLLGKDQEGRELRAKLASAGAIIADVQDAVQRRNEEAKA